MEIATLLNECPSHNNYYGYIWHHSLNKRKLIFLSFVFSNPSRNEVRLYSYFYVTDTLYSLENKMFYNFILKVLKSILLSMLLILLSAVMQKIMFDKSDIFN